MDIIENPQNISQEAIASPWEQRDRIGFPKALWQTIYMVLFKPSVFFGHTKVSDTVSEPFIFYFVIILFTSFVTLILVFLNPQEMPAQGAQIIFGFVMMMIYMCISIFFVSAVINFSSRVMGGQGNFTGTFQVMAYCSARNLIGIFPVIGLLISFIWGFVIGTTGIKKAHNLSAPKAFFAYASPYMLAACLASAFILIAKPDFSKMNTCPYKSRQHQISNPSLGGSTETK